MPHRPSSPCLAEPTCPHDRPCPVHNDDREPTAARGYGGAHQAIATQLRRLYPTGPCGRCGARGTWTDRADPLTAGHIVHDGPTVLANYQPEHRSCGNREAGARRAAAGRRGAP